MSLIRDKIIATFRETLEENNQPVDLRFDDEMVLLESGLDSLGFAILVTRLEDELGFDPFVLMDEPVYPRTLGDFVDIYERFSPPSK